MGWIPAWTLVPSLENVTFLTFNNASKRSLVEASKGSRSKMSSLIVQLGIKTGFMALLFIYKYTVHFLFEIVRGASGCKC